jgi:hypothetical protein
LDCYGSEQGLLVGCIECDSIEYLTQQGGYFSSAYCWMTQNLLLDVNVVVPTSNICNAPVLELHLYVGMLLSCNSDL